MTPECDKNSADACDLSVLIRDIKAETEKSQAV